MDSLDQYFAFVNSRNLTDRIIAAIDDASMNNLIQTACHSSREDLDNYRKDLTDKIEKYQKTNGIELRINDLELTELTFNSSSQYCIIFDLDKERFNSIFNPHLKVGVWSTSMPYELRKDQSKDESSVDVVESESKVYVFLKNELAAHTIIEYYLTNKPS